MVGVCTSAGCFWLLLSVLHTTRGFAFTTRRSAVFPLESTTHNSHRRQRTAWSSFHAKASSGSGGSNRNSNRPPAKGFGRPTTSTNTTARSRKNPDDKAQLLTKAQSLLQKLQVQETTAEVESLIEMAESSASPPLQQQQPSLPNATNENSLAASTTDSQQPTTPQVQSRTKNQTQAELDILAQAELVLQRLKEKEQNNTNTTVNNNSNKTTTASEARTVTPQTENDISNTTAGSKKASIKTSTPSVSSLQEKRTAPPSTVFASSPTKTTTAPNEPVPNKKVLSPLERDQLEAQLLAKADSVLEKLKAKQEEKAKAQAAAKIARLKRQEEEKALLALMQQEQQEKLFFSMPVENVTMTSDKPKETDDKERAESEAKKKELELKARRAREARKAELLKLQEKARKQAALEFQKEMNTTVMKGPKLPELINGFRERVGLTDESSLGNSTRAVNSTALALQTKKADESLFSLELRPGVKGESIGGAAVTAVVLAAASGVPLLAAGGLAAASSLVSLTRGATGDCMRAVGELAWDVLDTAAVQTVGENCTEKLAMGTLELGFTLVGATVSTVTTTTVQVAKAAKRAEEKRKMLARQKRIERNARALLAARLQREASERARIQEQKERERIELERVRLEQKAREIARQKRIEQNARALLTARLERETKIRERMLQRKQLERQERERARVEHERALVARKMRIEKSSRALLTDRLEMEAKERARARAREEWKRQEEDRKMFEAHERLRLEHRRMVLERVRRRVELEGERERLRVKMERQNQREEDRRNERPADSQMAEKRRTLMEYRFKLQALQKEKQILQDERRKKEEQIRLDAEKEEERKKQMERRKDSLVAEKRRGLMEFRFQLEKKKKKRAVIEELVAENLIEMRSRLARKKQQEVLAMEQKLVKEVTSMKRLNGVSLRKSQAVISSARGSRKESHVAQGTALATADTLESPRQSKIKRLAMALVLSSAGFFVDEEGVSRK